MNNIKSFHVIATITAVFLFSFNAQAEPPENIPPSTPQELQDQITQEVTDRTNSDQILKNWITQEVTDRTNGDQNLQDQITQEVTGRTNGDQNLQDQITQEVTGRTNGDQALQDQIDAITPPSSGRLNISGAFFIPLNPSWDIEWFTRDGWGALYDYASVPAGDFDLGTSVNLPDGVKVSRFTCYWYDNYNPIEADFWFQLMKRQGLDADSTEMAFVRQSTNDYPPSDSVRFTSTYVISDPVIDNYHNFYYIHGNWYQYGFGFDDVRFYGCQVAYDIP